jgi:hypothetical protein
VPHSRPASARRHYPSAAPANASTASPERIPNSSRYRVTDSGLHIALFFTRTYNRLLHPALTATPLQRAFFKRRSKNQPHGDAALRIAQPAAGSMGWRSNSRQYRGRCPCIAPSC